MKLLNPTGYDIVASADGMEYRFPKFAETEVYETSHGRHLAKSAAYLGLVHLVFNDAMKKKYREFDKFEHKQKLNGLNALRKWMKGCLINEKQAVRDIKERSGGEADRDLMNPQVFEDKLADIDAWIKDVEGQRPRGRPKKDGPQHNNNESATKA